MLFEVTATVFLGITVTVVTAPLFDRLVDQGIPERVASGLVVVLVVLVGVAVVVPIGVFIYLRRDRVIEWVASLPESVLLEFDGLSHVIHVGGVLE